MYFLDSLRRLCHTLQSPDMHWNCYLEGAETGSYGTNFICSDPSIFPHSQGPMDRRNEPEAAVPSDLNPNPLEYRPMESSTHTYKMVDGVMQVYDAPSGEVNLFPVRVQAWGRSSVVCEGHVQRWLGNEWERCYIHNLSDLSPAAVQQGCDVSQMAHQLDSQAF